MHQKRLAAGLRPDPLGELTMLPRLPSCILGVRVEIREGKETAGGGQGMRGQRKDEGREGRN